MKYRTLVIAAATLAAGGAIAGEPAEPGMHRAGHPMVMRLDTDQDGKVSREEFEAGHAERFAQLDADGSGGLSFEEMAAGMHRHAHGKGQGKAEGDRQAGERGERRLQYLQERYAAADADGDGSLSRAEFDALGAARFGHMDANGDGAIEPGEMGRGRHHRHAADAEDDKS